MDWPEGSELLVEPLLRSEKMGLEESEWRDDPQSIADWLAWVDTIEPLLLSDEERADMERYRAEHRRYNLEAVRQQMKLGGHVIRRYLLDTGIAQDFRTIATACAAAPLQRASWAIVSASVFSYSVNFGLVSNTVRAGRQVEVRR